MIKRLFVGLLLTVCLFSFALLSQTGTASGNWSFLLYTGFMNRQLENDDERFGMLRQIKEVSGQNTEGFSFRQSTLAGSVDRILKQIETDVGQTCADEETALLSAPLPQPISVGNGLELLEVEVLSGSGDYAAGNALTIRLRLQPAEKDGRILDFQVDAFGWRADFTDTQIIACGELPNLVENAGYEYPAFIPPNVPGILDPVHWWGAEPDGWRLLSKGEGIAGESICVSKTRFAPPMSKVKQGQWLAFGGYFRGEPYPITPYLAVINTENVADVPITLAPSVMKEIGNPDWRFGYGVVQAPVDGYVTLYVDGWQNPDVRTCLDNLFIIPLPKVLLTDGPND